MVIKSLLGSAWKCRRTVLFKPVTTVHVAVRWRSKPAKYRQPSANFESGSKQAQILRDGLNTGSSSADAPQKFRKSSVSAENRRSFVLFEKLVNSHFKLVLDSMDQQEFEPFGITNESHLEREIDLFKKALDKCFSLATERGMIGLQDNPLFWNLRNAYVKAEIKGLRRGIEHTFQTFMMRNRFPEAINQLHASLADMRFPYEWYPATRQIQRTIHLHVGPTNSGKTYNALKALENAKTGIYAGPLRLLAHEIFTRFTAKSLPCALVTGEELRVPKDADRWFHSCTVEMSPLNQKVDVAVIDEIQMIADDDRGWAWTQAVLGIQAKELHLCGEDRVVPLIQELCARIGDKCEVHRYERLNPLSVMNRSLKGSLKNLQKGDAVVSFSRVSLHAIKRAIEESTRRRCAIVYGSLPPETRATQAALFNDPNNDYDFLVASDAIGMGLNLEIKRVIFETSSKFDGMRQRSLTVPEIKQIGGRAGRYRTAAQEITSAKGGDEAITERVQTPGYVTTLDEDDLPVIDQGFRSEAPPIVTAGIFPPASIIEKFHTYFPPQTPTKFVLSRLQDLCRLSPRFHLCDFTTALEIAQAIQDFDLSVSDRCVFLNAPVDFRAPGLRSALRAFAKCVAENGSGHLLDFTQVDLDALNAEYEPHERQTYLQRLEALHKTIALYLWLSYRYEGVFQSQSLAFHVKDRVEAKISEILDHLSFRAEDQARIRAAKRAMAKKHKKREEDLLGGELEAGEIQEHGEGVGRWEEQGHEEPLFERIDEVNPARIVRQTLAEAAPESTEATEQEKEKAEAQG